MVGFSSDFLFLARKWELVTRVEPGDIPPDAKDNQGASIVKGWETKRDHGLFQIHSHKTRITRTLNPQQLNPDSLHPIYIYFFKFIYYTVTSSHHHRVVTHRAKKRATVIEKQSLRKKRKTESFPFMPFKL